MSNKFELTLRSKTAEQLLNMRQNKSHWDEDQQVLIKREIEKRGLEVFEEPQPWDEDEMSELNTYSPTTEFEKDMSVILDFEQKEKDTSGLQLASQLISISAVIVVLVIGLFLPLSESLLYSFTIVTSLTSLGMYIAKRYKVSIVFGCIALLLNVTLLMLFVQEYL
jgi:hypothetical protein